MSRAALWGFINRTSSLLHSQSSFAPQIKCLSTRSLCVHINEQHTETKPYQHFLTKCENGQLDSALQMLSQESLPENLYVAFLKVCIRKKELHHVQQAFSHVVSLRSELNGLLGDYFVTAFVKCGSMSSALQAFHCLNPRTVYAWTAMISGYASCGNGSEALRLYQLMKQDDIQPDQYTYVRLFKACGSISDLEEGRKLHFEVRRKCLMSNPFVANSILSMYCKAKSLAEAEFVFSTLPDETRNVVSWNALLSGYVDQGDSEKALILYRQMQDNGTEANELTFVTAIQACSPKESTSFSKVDQERCLVIGQALHADACKKGFVSHPLVASTLMCMYGKYMEIEKAEYVFSNLIEHNLVIWTTMLKGYVEKGQGENALQLYKPMLEKKMCLDQQAFVLFFQACCVLAKEEEPVILEGQSLKLRSLEIGRELHKDAKKNGLDKDAFVGGTIVNMYGKCGSVADAENAFMELPQHDMVAWNVMLSAYTEQGQSEKALYLYSTMLRKIAVLDERSIVSILQACIVHLENNDYSMSIKTMCLELCNSLHVHACKCGFASNVFVGNTLINMYGKFGCILEAEHVFLFSSRFSIVTWNVMLGVYLELEQCDKSLELFRQLQEFVIPDERTFVIVLQACLGLLHNEFSIKDSSLPSGQMMLLDIVTALHADAWKQSFMTNVFVGNSFITLYAKCRAVNKAEVVFNRLVGRSVVSWNAMLSAYTETKQAYRAFQLYLHMHQEGRNPDPQTFVVILQACSLLIENVESIVENGASNQNMALDICKALHIDAQRHGFTNNVYVANSLLSIYGKCGRLDDAADAFYGLCQRNVVSWNALLTAYIDHEKGDQALSTYEKMISAGVVPNEVTLICILQACSETGSSKLCREIHFTVASNGLDASLAVATTVVHAYGGSASIIDSEVTFNAIHLPTVESWNAVICSFAGEENHDISTLSFQEMYSRGIQPSKATFSVLLLTFSHCGLIGNGLYCFVSMNEAFGLEPEIKHYVIITDLFGRAGDFGKVENIMSCMPMQPDLAFWLCLLGSCRIHGNLELGERAYNHAMCLQPDEAALYVSLSNIYADVRNMAMYSWHE